MTIQAYRSVAFFIRLKKDRDPNTMFSAFNHFIIISIYFLLTIRLCNHVAMNLVHMYSILFKPKEGLFFLDWRSIALQVRNLGELSLVCYMLRVQDKRI